VKLRGETFRLWMHRELTGRIKSGNFSQDSRGRWYCNLVCEVEAPKTTNRTKVVASTSASRPSLLRATAGISSKPISTAISRRSSPTLSDATRSGW